MTHFLLVRSLAMALILSLCSVVGAATARAEGALTLTVEDIKRISPKAQDVYAEAMVAAAAEFEAAGITTPLRMAHFMAQVMTETGGLGRLDENMNYSYETLLRVFSRRTISEPKAREIARKPREIANWVYGARLGNRGRDTEDGWSYRGSGFIQLTGRANFRARGAEIGLPLEDDPELARQAQEGLKAAIAYWTARGINAAADDHDRLRVRKLVNGPAAHGYEQSKVWFNRAWTQVFQGKEALGFEGAVGLAEATTGAADESALFEDILERSGVLPGDLGATEADQATRADALRAYQRELGLSETGVLDEATRDALLDPREWRHEDEGAEPLAAISDPEATVGFDMGGGTGTESGAVLLMPSEGTGAMVAEAAMPRDIVDALSDASAMYSEYEMGGRSVTPESWVPFSVIGEDDRVAVNDTTTFPDRAIVQILFDNGFGGTSLCSGTMVSADTVLTAAHCIHSGTLSGRAYSAYRVLPGRNRAVTPFGECGVRRAFVLQGWTGSLNAEEARYYDLGALKLDCRVGEATGWAGVRIMDVSEVGEATIVQGYAADMAPPGRQWVSTDSLRILWDLKGFYLNDTYGGTSGSPVFLGDDRTTIVGVHTNGLHGEEPWASHNAFTRITPERMQRISQWIAE
ncbi:trypsin-like serine protease [Rhodovulum euryhalinum]|uniref:Serine protease n=1 Tax=Rhodovulum euryhalinum TaxID=35805 RepID=A0A4R2KEZ7_9RHOB|nr:trypsin-like serine protease [Rhodovulum euryhalinum]TCO70787.1 putative chitinase [Rhodovulum euryhalinum]